MRSIQDFDFKNKRALIRVDFNVPLDKSTFAVTDDSRLKAAIPTIKKILDDGGSVVLMSHLGRPKDGPDEKYSLKHIVKHLSELLEHDVKFAEDCIGDDVRLLALNLLPGEILLLENLRFRPEEEKGDMDFAIQLSELGNVYVNDAFGTAHRAHASTTIVASLYSPENKMAGFLLAAEVDAANKVLNDHEKPFTAIIGGAKVSDKILILEKLVEKADHIIVGGGMAYTFIKAMGGDIGNSLCEEDKLDLAKQLIENAKTNGATILLPVDSVIADKFDNDAAKDTCISNIIPAGWMGLDIGENAIKDFSEIILASKTILWNGPMGVFEMENFSNGTIQIAKTVAQATQNGAYSLVGGGDSVAALNKFNLSDKVSYVSTGGGAMLEFFEGKILPGVEALEKN